MLQQITIYSNQDFDFQEFNKLLGPNDIVLSITPDDIPDAWGFYRKERSTTMFSIEKADGMYVLSMDNFASYDDYRFFPYLLDTLNSYLIGPPYRAESGKNAFQEFDEEWVEFCIGEEVALLKCLLSIGHKYYFDLPLSDAFPYVTESLLNKYGVTIHSSSPRIYGYIQYMLRNGLAPEDDEREEVDIDEEVDVPQHESIGFVKSWQTDGAETTESYAKEDIEQLLAIARNYNEDDNIPGVVLNDIGTIHEHGIGVKTDIRVAIRWYEEAIKKGDHYYAPTNLGDIHRRGLLDVMRDARLAIKAYHQSDDPYAWYRIGQSFEEGWVEEPDMETAMLWYKKAAAAHHHLAIDRLNEKNITI